MGETWWTYVERVGGGVAQKELAARSGIEATAFTRWKQGQNRPRAEQVVQFARAYGKAPLEALIAAGYITAEEAYEVVVLEASIEDFSDAALLAEIDRRLHDKKAKRERMLGDPNAPSPTATSAQSGAQGEAPEDEKTGDEDEGDAGSAGGVTPPTPNPQPTSGGGAINLDNRRAEKDKAEDSTVTDPVESLDDDVDEPPATQRRAARRVKGPTEIEQQIAEQDRDAEQGDGSVIE